MFLHTLEAPLGVEGRTVTGVRVDSEGRRFFRRDIDSRIRGLSKGWESENLLPGMRDYVPISRETVNAKVNYVTRD